MSREGGVVVQVATPKLSTMSASSQQGKEKRKQKRTKFLIVDDKGKVKIKRRKLKLREDTLDCPLCLRLLYEPVTTSCGHTFCKSCILRQMDHANQCPLCRAVIYITPECGTSVLLQQIIQQHFPVQHLQRKQEIQRELRSQKFNLPLFLLGETILFPQMTLPLHVFEPRYRLMIRRCLEGGRRFGIVPTLNNQLSKIGTTAVIENHWVLPDGRSLIATVGDARFEVNDVWDQDGYKVAKVDYIQDKELDQAAQKNLQETFKKVKEMVPQKFSAGTLNQIQEKLGKMPDNNATEFAWWLAYILPVPVEKKYKILKSLSILERLEMLVEELESLDLSQLEQASQNQNLNQ